MAKEYYIVVNDRREGPLTYEQLGERGLEPSTLVWTAGIPDWVRADSLPELSSLLTAQVCDDGQSAFGSYARPQQPPVTPGNANGAYGYNNGGYNSGYNNGYSGGEYNSANSNWYTLSIVATVLGFLLSCIGGIIGILGIVNGSAAREAERNGDMITAQSKWSTCKTLTIISFVLSGIGLIANIVMLSSLKEIMSRMPY